MLDPQLLALLVCPVTLQDVWLAAPAELEQINEAILANRLVTVSGEAVSTPLQGALIRADATLAYPIRDGIPVMLKGEAVILAPVALSATGGRPK